MIEPSKACSGVRATPVPVVPGSVDTIRATLLSKREGWPYGANGAPTSRIHGSTCSGPAAFAELARPAPAATAAPPRNNARRSNNPLPATGCSSSCAARRILLRIRVPNVSRGPDLVLRLLQLHGLQPPDYFALVGA